MEQGDSHLRSDCHLKSLKMKIATQQRLLELNRIFYARVAREFDRSRGGLPAGWELLAPYLPPAPENRPLSVLDAGCGNGRFARFLAGRGGTYEYTGLDADATLLQSAAEQNQALAGVRSRFVQADLTEPGWSQAVQAEEQPFDLVVCFAVLHHLPGLALRQRVLAELASLLAPSGVLILSNWQFLTSARFAGKIIGWETIGLSAVDVEPGDALLPWHQGVEAVRYVHQMDEGEVDRLAAFAGLNVTAHFYADGKEGNLNLYSILYFALIENRSFLTSKNSGSQFNRSIGGATQVEHHVARGCADVQPGANH
jgi:2-polyprenyl-3-methyl-5-hydroxy-6-metoxy-1,4-benzoquinol methylase